MLNAQLVELAAEALTTGAWHGWGVRSLEHWLTWQAGVSPGHAREVVRLARARETHPVVMASFAEGALSVDQAAVATKAPPYLDAHIAETAPCATVSQLRTMVRAARSEPVPSTGVEEPAETLTGFFDDDGRYHLRGELDADHGRVVDAALTEARDALFHAGRDKVTWAEALVEVAQRSLDALPAAERRERFRVNWFVDPTDPIPARWTDGLAVPAGSVRCCPATPRWPPSSPTAPDRSASDTPSVPCRIGPDGSILHRDRKCRVPWCPQTRWLHVHHVEHVADGGATDTANLIAICPADHRLHHRGQLGISGDADRPDGLTFTDARRPGHRPGRPDRSYRPVHHRHRPNRTTTRRRTTPTLGRRLPRPTRAASARVRTGVSVDERIEGDARPVVGVDRALDHLGPLDGEPVRRRARRRCAADRGGRRDWSVRRSRARGCRRGGRPRARRRPGAQARDRTPQHGRRARRRRAAGRRRSRGRTDPVRPHAVTSATIHSMSTPASAASRRPLAMPASAKSTATTSHPWRASQMALRPSPQARSSARPARESVDLRWQEAVRLRRPDQLRPPRSARSRPPRPCQARGRTRMPSCGQLRRLDRQRRVGHRIGTRLRLREGDDLADVLLAGEDGDEPVEAEGEATVRRGAVLERVEEEAELAHRPPRR